jgi:hypothetical protein
MLCIDASPAMARAQANGWRVIPSLFEALFSNISTPGRQAPTGRCSNALQAAGGAWRRRRICIARYLPRSCSTLTGGMFSLPQTMMSLARPVMLT